MSLGGLWRAVLAGRARLAVPGPLLGGAAARRPFASSWATGGPWARAAIVGGRASRACRVSRGAARRPFSTSVGGGSLIPAKGMAVRIIWTGLVAAAGYFYYQVSVASEWVSRRAVAARDVLLDCTVAAIDAIDGVSYIVDGLSATIDGHRSWLASAVTGYFRPLPRRAASEDGQQAAPLSVDASGAPPAGGQSLGWSNDAFGDFTKRMIRVRNILRAAAEDDGLGGGPAAAPSMGGASSTITLPTIVVIGSQSSGKSSVLESIVGHAFLPKGLNMVTRRPLELTLVNDAEAQRDYALFGDGTPPIYDFEVVRSRIAQMNLAVPPAECISDVPIEVAIHSQGVPDLTMVDLPGYIQLSNRSQPPLLRERIAALCRRYIEASDNIILAVSPADQDLATSEALQASRLVDPRGTRTIGVVTKVDLVPPSQAVLILANDDYPLQMGYVGVICRSSPPCPPSGPPAPAEGGPEGASYAQQAPPGGAFARGLLSAITTGASSSTSGAALEHGERAAGEAAFIAENGPVLAPVRESLGIGCLRERLTGALQRSMEASLAGTLGRVQGELENIRYALKAEYNDQAISPEGYVASLATALKASLDAVAAMHSRQHVRSHLEGVLHDRILVQAIQSLWREAGPASDRRRTLQEAFLQEEAPAARAISSAVSSVTRSGIGRLATGSVVEGLVGEVRRLLQEGPLASHPQLQARILERIEGAMRMRCGVAIEQVENAIKPYKYGVEYTDGEWRRAWASTLDLLARRGAASHAAFEAIQREVGARRLRSLVEAELLRLSSEEPFATTASATTASATTNAATTNAATTNAANPPFASPPFATPALQAKAREAVAQRAFARTARERLANLQDKALPCSEPLYKEASLFARAYGLFAGGARPPQARGAPEQLHQGNVCQQRCPEVYLHLVTDRMLSIAALYLHHELIHDFLAPLPDELASLLPAMAAEEGQRRCGDRRHGAAAGDEEGLCAFASENASVARHLRLQRRRRLLESVREQLAHLDRLRPPQGGRAGG